MVDVKEALKFEITAEDSGFRRGINNLKGGFDKARVHGKEFGVEIGRIGGLLDKLKTGALIAGASLIGLFTGALAMSPQFKEFLGKMKKPMMDLSMFMGEKFKPVLDTIVETFQKFVNFITGSRSVNFVLGLIAKGLTWVVEGIGEFIDKIAAQMRAVESVVISFKNWIGEIINTHSWIKKLVDMIEKLWNLIKNPPKPPSITIPAGMPAIDVVRAVTMPVTTLQQETAGRVAEWITGEIIEIWRDIRDRLAGGASTSVDAPVLATNIIDQG